MIVTLAGLWALRLEESLLYGLPSPSTDLQVLLAFFNYGISGFLAFACSNQHHRLADKNTATPLQHQLRTVTEGEIVITPPFINALYNNKVRLHSRSYCDKSLVSPDRRCYLKCS